MLISQTSPVDGNRKTSFSTVASPVCRGIPSPFVLDAGARPARHPDRGFVGSRGNLGCRGNV